MIEHVRRDDGNGYRSYSHQHVAWIEFLKRLRATGMPIRDIQRYTELLRQGEQTVPERLQLLKQHQSRVEQHLKEVEQHLEAISSKIAYHEQVHCQHQPVSCSESLPSRNEERTS
jgi:DNA-binding transcriptional MerR regulator